MTAFVLKLIAVVTMLIDHVGAVLPVTSPMTYRWVGRIAFPLFAYMVSQGCRNTRSIYKYMLRLGVFAVISEIPFDLAFGNGISFLYDTNIFYTLFLGVAAVAAFKKLKNVKFVGPFVAALAVVPCLLAAEALETDYGAFGVALIFLLYLAQHFQKNAPEGPSQQSAPEQAPLKNAPETPSQQSAPENSSLEDSPDRRLPDKAGARPAAPAGKIAGTAVLAAGMLYFYGRNAVSFSDMSLRVANRNILGLLLFSLVAVPLAFLYNGRQGPRFKWFFYVFYPLHLTALFIIKQLMTAWP